MSNCPCDFPPYTCSYAHDPIYLEPVNCEVYCKEYFTEYNCYGDDKDADEYDEDYWYDGDYDIGFDPYLGCYTDDC